MAELNYKKLPGMSLDYVSGRLEANPKERAIRYTVTFDMGLNFAEFVKMANEYIPDYLGNPINAIRPELDGLAYHYSYNYMFEASGGIGDNAALFSLFKASGNYMDKWATGAGLEVRYGKPELEIRGTVLRITARRDIRLADESRHISIEDLPTIQFYWALNLMEGHFDLFRFLAPTTKVVLMPMDEDLVEVEGQQMFRGTRYIKGRQLGFGEIPTKQILTAQ